MEKEELWLLALHKPSGCWTQESHDLVTRRGLARIGGYGMEATKGHDHIRVAGSTLTTWR